MPRPPEQYEAMRTATLERIQAAAISLFARHGMPATGIRDIAQAAGVSTGLVYRHHTSKAELFDTLVRQAADGLRELALRLRGGGSPEETLGVLTRDVVTAISRDDTFAEFIQLMNQAFAAPDPPPGIDELALQHTAVLDGLEGLIVDGQRTGCFRTAGPRELAVGFLAALSGLAAMKVSLGDSLVIPEPEVITGLVARSDS